MNLDRRAALAGVGSAVFGALAGCSATATGPPSVDPHTGLDRDTASALDDERVLMVGDATSLPDLPRTVTDRDEATLVLATADAPTATLAAALRAGRPVAITGGDAPEALAALLGTVGDTHHYGIETIAAHPVETVVADPNGDTIDTYQFVREGGWDDPVLDPVGWALTGRLPEPDTFVPERRGGREYAPLGTATIAGRLPTGETYAAQTVGSRYVGNLVSQSLRVRTTVHAAATGGYAVADARRVADCANDAQLSRWFPNPHQQGGVEVSNYSSSVAERLDVTFAPASDRARGALTGSCGLTAEGTFAYDHRTRWSWERNGVFDSDGHYGGGVGRGTWHVHE